jgi:hypothetical protein
MLANEYLALTCPWQDCVGLWREWLEREEAEPHARELPPLDRRVWIEVLLAAA